MTKNSINCPNCGTIIDVNEGLTNKIEEDLKKKYNELSTKRELELNKQLDSINALKNDFEKQKSDYEKVVREQVQKSINIERKKIEEDIKKKFDEENSDRFDLLQKELNEKSNKLKDLNRALTEIERLKREKDELRETIELEKERQFNDRIREEKEKIKKNADEEHFLKYKDYEKTIEDMKAQMAEVQRKAEQRSMQLQGEVQELELEMMLREKYPFDEIIEVKKGQRGADCIQRVRTQQGIDCGKIYYESKRTKDFQNVWIQKLKDDNLEAKADILIIVTQAMPENHEKVFFKDGVWICSFNEIKWFTMIIRQYLIDLQSVAITQHNKDAKMEMLYNYLTGLEFKGQLEAIIEGFSSLQNGYLDEKKKMMKIWSEREKQLEKIITNTVNFYGSLKGIAGASIPNIAMLEDSDPNKLL